MTSKLDQLDFESIRRVHIVGVCGTLMGAFAAFLKRKGIQVTGSDQSIYPPMSDVLREAGVELMNGYRPEHLAAKPQLVVIGNVIRADNPEAQAAIQGGLTYVSLPEAMEKLFLKKTCNLVVAGTHGKTTTSSLLAHVLTSVGKDPSYFIGGVSYDLPVSFHLADFKSKGPSYFVLEGDEYDTAFWDKVPKFNHYLPDQVILTSIEYDHADIYPDFASVERAFEGLVERIRPGGSLIACYDYESVRKLVKQSKVPVISYGTTVSARYRANTISCMCDETRFQILEGTEKIEEISLKIPGTHNVLNALSVWIQCRELGLHPLEIKKALNSFKGVKRRQEIRGEFQGVLIIDDFAHHPTAVKETLRALRAKYPHRRLVTVFEPRSATSRRKVFQKDYVDAFAEADSIWIATPFDQSRIAATDQFSSQVLAEDLVKRGKVASVFPSVDEGVQGLVESSKNGDVIAVLSNGGFGGLIGKLIAALSSSS
jgi:UDP-N-acetylmuramate: L-alanyl-gamma-D-glutamyl-meso-diaminopimelate ligase